MQSAIGRLRSRGSVRAGAAQWKALRYTSVATLLLVVWFMLNAVGMVGASHAEWAAWFRSPLNASLMVLLVVTMFYHTRLGVQEVIEDYVHHEGLKVTALIGTTFLVAVLATACLVSILMLATGA